jgi:hypothetical protein
MNLGALLLNAIIANTFNGFAKAKESEGKKSFKK